MGLVLDASAAIGWTAESDAAVPLLHRIRDEAVHAPMLWWYEVHNALVVKERRGLQTREATDAFMALLAGLGVALDTAPDRAGVIRFARAQGLSVNDAAYLELAHRLGLPLATFDRALAKAAEAESVAVVGLGF